MADTGNGAAVPLHPPKDVWPAGRERTADFARRLCDLPAGYALMEDSMSAQRMMQAGHAPQPMPADTLVACGLCEVVNGYAFATNALRSAAALFEGGE